MNDVQIHGWLCPVITSSSMDDSLASMVYNYKHGFSGFAAMLTEDEAKQVAGEEFNLRLLAEFSPQLQ